MHKALIQSRLHERIFFHSAIKFRRLRMILQNAGEAVTVQYSTCATHAPMPAEAKLTPWLQKLSIARVAAEEHLNATQYASCCIVALSCIFRVDWHFRCITCIHKRLPCYTVFGSREVGQGMAYTKFVPVATLGSLFAFKYFSNV